MQYIKLTQGKFAKVDDEDFEELNKFNWHFTKLGYACRTVGSKCRKIRLHNQIMGAKGIDHINGNRLDNQRSNLRLATQQQNCYNRIKSGNYGNKITSSKYKGVTLHRDGKWQVVIAGKYSGLYKTEIEAANKYNQLATNLFGEFAKLNSI